MTITDLAKARIKTAREHIALEQMQDWDGVIATFAGHPRYEMHGSNAVYDGEDAVRAYFAATRTPFPDQRAEIIAIAADGQTVLVEYWVLGTHLGPLQLGERTVQPSGKSFRVRGALSFEFALESDRIVCERAYFDGESVFRALGIC
jgi:steroid delta-isomerase-like uncharacterized protein